MKISSLADFIPEFQKKDPLNIDFDERISDMSSHQDRSSGICFDKYKYDCDYLFEVMKRINLEYQEAQETILKLSADESYNSIVQLIKISEKRLSSELSEVLDYFVSEETVRRVLCAFSSCLHKFFQDKLVGHLSASGNRHLIERIRQESSEVVLEDGVIDDESEQINIKNRNTTFVLDLSHFKSYLKEEISLETQVERSR